MILIVGGNTEQIDLYAKQFGIQKYKSLSQMQLTKFIIDFGNNSDPVGKTISKCIIIARLWDIRHVTKSLKAQSILTAYDFDRVPEFQLWLDEFARMDENHLEKLYGMTYVQPKVKTNPAVITYTNP